MPNTVNSYIETDLGNVSPNPRGEYNATYDYEYLDLIYYKGGSYVCLAPLGETIKNVPPIVGQTTTNWQCVAIPGDLTPEYISMYNEVVKDYNETNTNTADVAQMKDVTYASMTAAQESESKASTSETNARNSEVNAKQSMDKAKEYSDEAIRAKNDTQSLVTGFDEHVTTAISNAEASISESTDNAKGEIIAQKSSSLNEFRTDAETVMTNEKNMAITEIHQMVDSFSADADSKKQEVIQVADEKINDMTALKNDAVNAKNAAETAATTAVEKASETATYAGEAKSSSDSAKANADLVSANKIEIDNAKSDVESKVAQFESDLETYSVRTLRSDMTELQKETSDGFSALKSDLNDLKENELCEVMGVNDFVNGFVDEEKVINTDPTSEYHNVRLVSNYKEVFEGDVINISYTEGIVFSVFIFDLDKKIKVNPTSYNESIRIISDSHQYVVITIKNSDDSEIQPSDYKNNCRIERKNYEIINKIKHEINNIYQKRNILNFDILHNGAFNYETGDWITHNSWFTTIINVENYNSLVLNGFEGLGLDDYGISPNGCACFSEYPYTNISKDIYTGRVYYSYGNDKNVHLSEFPRGTKYITPFFNASKDFQNIKVFDTTVTDYLNEYDTNNNPKNYFKNKKIGVLGDSISAGQYSEKSYSQLVAEYFNMTINNVSVPGYTLSQIYTTIDNLPDELDIVFLMGGTNNYKSTNDEGMIGDFFVTNEGVRSLNTDNTISGWFNKILTKLRNKYPKALIILITPPKSRLWLQLSSHPTSPFDAFDLRDCYYKASQIHSCPLFDLGSECMLNSHNETQAPLYYQHFYDYGRDLTHPTLEGHKVIAKYIIGKLMGYAYSLN